jgi:hypothetical protein
MSSPTSESCGDLLTNESKATPIRYPHTVAGYPLVGLFARPNKNAKHSHRPNFSLARPRRMRSGSRGLLWWIPFWYILAQIPLLLWIDPSWQPNRVRVELDKKKQLHERIAEAPDRPLVVMFGSSRTDWAFQAGRLTGVPGPDGQPLLAYNFGVPTTGPMHECLYLHELLDEGIRPRLILVEFVATHLNQSRRGILSEERFTIPTWLSAKQVFFLRPYLSNRRRIVVEWLEARLAPWYGYRWSIHEHLQGKHSLERPWDQARRPMDDWGCRQLFDDPNTPEFRAWRWVGAFDMYGHTLNQFRVGQGPLQAMRDLVLRCRRERIPIAVVVMPVTKEFESLYNPESRVQLANVLDELRDREGIEIIDGKDWLDREDFDDGHHVIRAGAEKFTGRLIEEVQRVLARTESSDALAEKHP